MVFGLHVAPILSSLRTLDRICSGIPSVVVELGDPRYARLLGIADRLALEKRLADKASSSTVMISSLPTAARAS